MWDFGHKNRTFLNKITLFDTPYPPQGDWKDLGVSHNIVWDPPAHFDSPRGGKGGVKSAILLKNVLKKRQNRRSSLNLPRIILDQKIDPP